MEQYPRFYFGGSFPFLAERAVWGRVGESHEGDECEEHVQWCSGGDARRIVHRALACVNTSPPNTFQLPSSRFESAEWRPGRLRTHLGAGQSSLSGCVATLKACSKALLNILHTSAARRVRRI